MILLSLFGVFVIVCALNPEVTDAVAAFLYPEKREEVPAESAFGQPDMPADGAFGMAPGGGDAGETPEGAENGSAPADEEAGADPVSVDILTGPEMGEIQDGPDLWNYPLEDGSGYVQPDQDEITIPGDVSGRNGYTPVTEEGRQIAEDEAEELLRQLGPGETGDGLSFDPLYYPYYTMLNEKGQHLYRQIYANANCLNDAFSPVEDVQVDELRSVFMAVYNDHPELFWMETAYYCKYRKNGQCAEIDLIFNRTAEDLESTRTVFDESAGQIISGAGNLFGNYEKEKYVHDALMDRIVYDTSAEMGQSAYSGLVNGRTVCAGYARAFQYILQQLGIPCYYCTGYAGENHAWNIVMLDDGFYNVDVTWDDTGENSYGYFNCSDQDYANTHIRREMSVNLPPCCGTVYRNPEAGTESNSRRSMEQLGIPQEEVLGSLEDYYAYCYQKIAEAGLGSCTFLSVVEGEDCLQQVMQGYQTESYKAGYMENAMKAVGAKRCEMGLQLEELQDGKYLITHQVTLR